ncbi:hypothetical protein BDZ97DRAFT_1913874 [Flammula alnicola]|nr:hypothetical protein BDZ97DRAFT_1913874 [Flammula alnicola]
MSLSTEELQNTDPKTKSPSSTSTCYIASIPDDILLEIFSTFLPDAVNERHFPFQKTLIPVCRPWRDMVMGTPLLWTKIRVPSITKYDTLVYFERSKPALIDVKFCTTWRHKPEKLEPIRDTIAKHLSRLRSLTISVDTEEDLEAVFRRWKDLETPNLKTLDIWTNIAGTWTSGNPSLTLPRVLSWKGMDARALRFLKLGSFDIQDFPPAPNLTSLDIKIMKLNPNDFRTLFDKFPSLDTLVIQKSERSSPLSQEDPINLSKINAESLRSLAINIEPADHSENCGCVLPFLSVALRNLEYLEVAIFSSRLTPHLASVFAQWTNLPRLQKLRIRITGGDLEGWKNNISFLSSLSKTTDLELIDLPRQVADTMLWYVLGLTNLHSITFNLAPSLTEGLFLDLEEFSRIIHERKPKLGCPTILQVPRDEKVHPQLREILGDSLAITTTPSEQAFLDVIRRGPFYSDSDDDETIEGHTPDEESDYNSDFMDFLEYQWENDDEYFDLYENHEDEGEYADDYTAEDLEWD